jgi:hypothetical protein
MVRTHPRQQRKDGLNKFENDDINAMIDDVLDKLTPDDTATSNNIDKLRIIIDELKFKEAN